MPSERIAVQRCGCIAIPEELAGVLGMLPGAWLSIQADVAGQSLILRVAESAPEKEAGGLAMCPVEP